MNHFTIKDIEALTGIKQHTIRIWEQRYGLVEPKRTTTNIRYYDDDDLKSLLNISLLNRNGYKISKISKLTKTQIDQIILEQSTSMSCANFQVHALMGCMLSLDEPAFNKILCANIEKSGIKGTMYNIVFPFLNHIGLLWLAGSINPAFEHFVTNIIKSKLYAAIDQLGFSNCNDKTKRALLFLPEGENHSLGLLFGHYLIRAAGHQSVYLGQNLPDRELDLVVNTFNPDLIFTAVAGSMTRVKIQEWIDSFALRFAERKVIVTGSGFLNNKLEFPSNVNVIRTPDCLEAVLNS